MAKQRDLLGTKSPVPEDMAVPVSELRGLVEKNVNKTGYLDRCGVQIDAMVVFTARVEFIIDHLCPPNSPERIDFEKAWQGKITEILDQYEGMLNRARLVGKAPPAPTLAENVQSGEGLVLP